MKIDLNILKASAGLLCATATYLLSTNIPVKAAESVVLRYGILQHVGCVTQRKYIFLNPELI
jgi:hypothetical protein